nr:TRAP transporter large permease subunit [uncultured Oscillibacter sp.]
MNPVAIMFLLFFGLLIIGVPIGVSIAITCVASTIIDPSMTTTAVYCVRNFICGIDVQSMLAIPLFIISGVIMARGGISKRLFDFFTFFLGRLPAGLPIAVIITCLFYGAISGSAPATVAAVGAMCIPILTNLGYSLEFTTALVTTAGSLGIIIPPSIPFIMYGLATGESVSSLFIAGIIPGFLIAFSLIAYAVFYCKTRGEDKEKLQENMARLRAQGFLGILKDSVFALLSPVIILGGIYSGIMTPTEAAGISVIYAVIVSMFIYKTVSFKDLYNIYAEALGTIAPIMAVVAFATVFGRVLTFSGVPQAIASFIASSFTSKVVLLIVLNIFLLIVGALMDSTPAILILAPIFASAVTQFGIDGVHFGVIMVVNLAIGFVTPPIGLNLYVASSMTKLPVTTIAKHALPFLLCFLAALLLITYIPAISLALV